VDQNFDMSIFVLSEIFMSHPLTMLLNYPNQTRRNILHRFPLVLVRERERIRYNDISYLNIHRKSMLPSLFPVWPLIWNILFCLFLVLFYPTTLFIQEMSEC
jgi:hypothetical protein